MAGEALKWAYGQRTVNRGIPSRISAITLQGILLAEEAPMFWSLVLACALVGQAEDAKAKESPKAKAAH